MDPSFIGKSKYYGYTYPLKVITPIIYSNCGAWQGFFDSSMSAYKGKTCPQMEIQSLSTHSHADIKSGKVLYFTKRGLTERK